MHGWIIARRWIASMWIDWPHLKRSDWGIACRVERTLPHVHWRTTAEGTAVQFVTVQSIRYAIKAKTLLENPRVGPACLPSSLKTIF